MTLKKIKQFLGKKHKKAIVFAHYIKYFSLKQPKQKQIIVCFDGLFPHGGLVDRLKGIVSFYQIAQVLGYDFKIIFNKPFELSTFLQPHLVDWQMDANNLILHPTKTKTMYLVNNFNVNPLKMIQNSKAKQFYVYANIDYGKTIFTELNSQQLENKWRNDFNQLFKKSKLLETKLNAITTEQFIAFHSRFTTLMGDFKDTTTKFLSKDEQDALCNNLVTIINRVKAEHNKNAFVFSDSINFINFAKQKAQVKSIKGYPFHMDNFNNNNNTDGHLKTLIDFFMIAKSDTVYFLNVKPMYNSSFSKYAAIVGQANFEVLEA
ncbi:hypothetical protein [Algibacter lectus]|uniref:Uncharacterized protein n=1 Tax=Algibacter lectus TaxID=221126 RepID=A0A090VDM0_9FLAO|nr:hypothetical protein [Algibacter lectus]GAL61469.1 hypothetical protein JCM19300_4415 [Algibacter lectus]